MRSARSREGFTLAELLVATTLLAITMSAVYTAFSGAIGTWRRGEANYQTYDTARLALGLMSRELSSMHPDVGHLMEGKEDDVLFYALASPMYVEKGAYARMLLIRYRLEAGRSSEGRTLIREEAFVESALPARTTSQDTIDTTRIKLGNRHKYEIGDGIKRLKFTYRWAPPEDMLYNPPGKPRRAVMLDLDENPVDTGMPSGIIIEMAVNDPIAPEGESVFREYVVFRQGSVPGGDVYDQLRVLNVPGFEIVEGEREGNP